MEGSSSSYIIKLDDLDLNYFRNDELSGKRLLFDVAARKLEYKEFQLFARKKEDSNNEETVQCSNDAAVPDQNYECSLCNIYVPVIYRREHDNSQKHRSCFKIAEIALDKIKNHILSAPDENPCMDKISNTYFCEPCAIGIKNVDKTAHESSSMHEKSLLHDRFLANFQMIYEDKKKIDEINFEHIFKKKNSNENDNFCDDTDKFSNENVNSSDENDNLSDENDDVSVNGNCDSSISDISDDDEAIANNMVCISNGTTENKSKIETNVKKNSNTNKWTAEKILQYIHILKSNLSQPTHKFTIIGPEFVRLKTVDKCVLEVSFDNFNGFYAPKEKISHIQCRICRVVITGTKEEHILSSEHIKKAKIPLQDMHCYRQVDAKYKHCVLCNDNFLDINSHILLNTHKAALLKSLKPSDVSSASASNVNSAPNSLSTETQDCVPSTSNSSSYAAAVQKQPPAVTSHLEISGKTFCNVCLFYIDTHNFASHAAGARHKTNLTSNHSSTKATTSQTPVPTSDVSATSTKPDPNKVFTYCNSCKRNIHTHNFAAYEKSLGHRFNAGTLGAPGTSSQTKKLHYHLKMLPNDKVHCRVCKTQVPNSERNMKEHVVGGTHVTNYITLLKSCGVERKDSSLFCGHCQISINAERVLDHISTHNASSSGNSAVRATKIPTQASASNQSVSNESNSNISIGTTPHNHFMLVDNANMAYCKVCKVNLPNVDRNIKEHSIGLPHMKNLRIFLRSNS